VRKCNCAGHCGPKSNQLSRRQFLEIVSVGSAATLLAGPALADTFELPAAELERWRRTLHAPAQPLVYSSGKHGDARMHLGGIGTGNFEIGADGQLTTWQLFNTLRDGQVPFHFLVRTENGAKLLQTKGGPEWPRVDRIEMRGEYPLARLQFVDTELPVQLELTAFTPFVPLDAGVSSLPLAAFVFRVHNPGKQARKVSLAALMQNPVGYEAHREHALADSACFGGNVNEVLHQDHGVGLLMRAIAVEDPKLDRAVTLYTGANLKDLKGPPMDRPGNLTVEILGDAPPTPDQLTDAAHTVFWFEEPASGMTMDYLGRIREAVKAGATLLFAGRTQPLLQSFGTWTGGKPVTEAQARPDVVFEDFENGYGNWTVEGTAFGQEPANGTLPNQQRVSGFVGRRLVNTYLGGDDPQGRLISKPFQIGRRYIRFLVGGGHFEETQVRLVVEGRTVRAASGKDLERLEPVIWDVHELANQTAHVEIVDARTGGWGHINVDQIEFSDLPGSRELMLALEELLPIRFSSARPAAGGASGANLIQLEDLTLQAGSSQTVTANGTSLFSRSVGKGRVVVIAGPVLEPVDATLTGARQRAYALVCGLCEAKYEARTGIHPKAPGFGTLGLVALGRDATVLPAAADLKEAWETFNARGHFTAWNKARASEPTTAGRTAIGAVGASVTVPAGKSAEVVFLLAWHFPNKYASSGDWVGCHYSTRWPDAAGVISEVAGSFESLRQRTEQFQDVFYNSTLPYWLLDCLTANAAIMRHIGIVFRLANGDVYGWEGSNGCCDPTCTHVWGYEQSFSRLFPELEKEMRRIDFKHQQRADGGINNRTHVPSPPHPTGEQPFADGHASCILKAYREALNHPDQTFFTEYWPGVKRGVEYLIERDAKVAGGQPSGVLQDDQWNTYDEALHGVTSFVTGYYLAALRAGEEWALRVGDSASAARFREVFLKGQARLIELCWNGEYFEQFLPDYAQRSGEVGPGCMADQLIGQWWAHQLGLGYILPRDKVVSSLKAIYKYNFKSDLTQWKHAPRAFAGAADKGLIICTWPKGGRPQNVMLYSDEVWTGIEYQVAAGLIYEGLIEEGFAIAKAARERYDGVPRPPMQRNPWNEIECGGHYARAMSSWSLLLATAGWEYDAPRGMVRFAPRFSHDNFKAFFSGPQSWGSITQSRQSSLQTNVLEVIEGEMSIRDLWLQPAASPNRVLIELAGKPLEHTAVVDNSFVHLSMKHPVRLRSGQSLQVRLTS
jgi:non-lysosomal glucosylceramidase